MLTATLTIPRFYERALANAPEDTSIMDALGEILLGLGEAERAFEVSHPPSRRRGLLGCDGPTPPTVGGKMDELN